MPTTTEPNDETDLPTAVAGLLRSRLTPAPRLLLTRDDEAALKKRIAADPRLSGLRRVLLKTADAICDMPPVRREMEGRRLLAVSRDVLRRVLTLALAYRLGGDKKHLAAVRDVMTAAAGFSDWNPDHFLDVAEMTTALAVGYDWLHADLADADLNVIRLAIREKGLEPSFDRPQFWITGENNWNQVCHAGMTLGALAIADHEPELCVKTVTRAVRSLPIAMANYAPDGAYPEGPMYWGYGTTFNVILIAALESALGTDFGLAAEPGFMKTADYYLHTTGPTGLFFNYGDCAEREATPTAAFFWMAARRADPALLVQQLPLLDALIDPAAKASNKDQDRVAPLLVVWAAAFAPGKVPTQTHYAGNGPNPVATHRTDWTPRATFVAVKGGSPSVSHGHMDAGSFVVDHDGERWAGDLGMQDYNSLETAGVQIWDGKPGGGRWTVFRINSQSHNVIMFDGESQAVDGHAKIVRSTDWRTEVDCAAMYPGRIAGHTRAVELLPSRTVRVEDRVRALPDKPAHGRWAVLTRAAVELREDGSVLLSRNGKRMTLVVRSPAGVRLAVLTRDPRPNAYDAPNPGVTQLGFVFDVPAGGEATYAIEFVPA